MKRGFADKWRCTVLAGVVMGCATAALAQGGEGRCWDVFPGFGRLEQPHRASNEDARRKPDAPNDLRPLDAAPLRSEIMIEALEAAIQRYQAIVASGGWPMVPGTRMIRPEDDDERMPLLRHRLAISGELSRR